MFCHSPVLLRLLQDPFGAVLAVKKAGIPLGHGQPQHRAELFGFVQFELCLALQLLVQRIRADFHRTGSSQCLPFSFSFVFFVSSNNLWLYYSSVLIYCQPIFEKSQKIVDFQELFWYTIDG